jgi:cytochrome c-type biogenesis protein CcmH
MKSYLFYKKHIFIIIGVFLFTILFNLNANANSDEYLKNISSKLRCMTCQNQTIYSSNTDFSLNIKNIIREKLKNGETEKEIIDFLIYRYGEYILFEPQMSKQNFFLWFFPFVILAISLAFLMLRIKKNT